MSLKAKVGILVTVITLSAYAFVSYFFVKIGEKMVVDFEREKVSLIESFVSGMMKPIMLNGSAELMLDILESYKTLIDMETIRILRADGTEAFSDDKTLKHVNDIVGWEKFSRGIFRTPPRIFAENDPVLVDVLSTNTNKVEVLEDKDGNSTVTMLVPFLNEEECHICHGADHEVRGILLGKFSMVGIEKARDLYLKQVLTISAILVLVPAFLIYFQFVRVVLNPVAGIIRDIKKIEGDDSYHTRLTVDRVDEIGDISLAFNSFISTVEDYRKAEETEKERLETAVREKTKELREKNRIIEDDLKVAQRIQNGLLPRNLPKVPHMDFYASYEPCMFIGGDYYDARDLGNGKISLFIGDATGHGSSAALIVSVVKAFLNTWSVNGVSTGKVVKDMNDFLYENTPDDTFITLFYGILDTKSGKMQYTLAGHPSPIIHNAKEDSISMFELCGGFVGAFKDSDFHERETVLKPGSRCFLFTDGLVEAANEDGDPFGMDRLSRLLLDNKNVSAEVLVQNIKESLRNHIGGIQLKDDITILHVDFMYGTIP